MNMLILIMGALIVLGYYRFYQKIKVIYIVRKFFDYIEIIKLYYELYTIVSDKEISKKNDVSFKPEVTKENIQSLLKLVEEAIVYGDKNCLEEFRVSYINECYEYLNQIAIELRRWLLWHNDVS